MAAAFIPLIAPLIGQLTPELIKLVASLVAQHAAAAEAKHGPGTGVVKTADVFVATMKDLTDAHASGQIAQIPDDATVKTIIQAVVTAMQVTNVLPASAPDAAATAASSAPAAGAGKPVASVAGQQAVSLKQGQTIVITIA